MRSKSSAVSTPSAVTDMRKLFASWTIDWMIATFSGREAVAAAVRRVKLVGVTGEVELDAKGDRKKAVYSVFQVAGADPERWAQNRVMKQVIVAPPSRN